MDAGRLPVDEQVAAFQSALDRTGTLAQVLARAAAVDLPGWHLVAGCLYQTVWNVATGQPPEAGILDYDLAYFDGSDLSWDAEDAVIRAGQRVFAGLPAPVQIRNQARVHLWYEQKFGIPVPGALMHTGRDRHLRGHHRLPSASACPRHPPATRRPPGKGRASPCPRFPLARPGRVKQVNSLPQPGPAGRPSAPSPACCGPEPQPAPHQDRPGQPPAGRPRRGGRLPGESAGRHGRRPWSWCQLARPCSNYRAQAQWRRLDVGNKK